MRFSLYSLSPVFFVAALAIPPVTPPEPQRDFSLDAAPKYDPLKWNRDPKVQGDNNCYAYASDDIDTKTFGAMPGKRTLNTAVPYLWTPYITWFQSIVKGAQADGMIYTGTKPATKFGYYRAVLMMHPDYRGYGYPYWHWLRQGPDGKWSGKDGNTAATNLDRNGHEVKDPARAVFGFNSSKAEPVAYFLVPRGGLDVGEPDEPKTHAATRPAYQDPNTVQLSTVTVFARGPGGARPRTPR